MGDASNFHHFTEEKRMSWSWSRLLEILHYVRLSSLKYWWVQLLNWIYLLYFGWFFSILWWSEVQLDEIASCLWDQWVFIIFHRTSVMYSPVLVKVDCYSCLMWTDHPFCSRFLIFCNHYKWSFPLYTLHGYALTMLAGFQQKLYYVIAEKFILFMMYRRCY